MSQIHTQTQAYTYSSTPTLLILLLFSFYEQMDVLSAVSAEMERQEQEPCQTTLVGWSELCVLQFLVRAPGMRLIRVSSLIHASTGFYYLFPCESRECAYLHCNYANGFWFLKKRPNPKQVRSTHSLLRALPSLKVLSFNPSVSSWLFILPFCISYPPGPFSFLPYLLFLPCVVPCLRFLPPVLGLPFRVPVPKPSIPALGSFFPG